MHSRKTTRKMRNSHPGVSQRRRSNTNIKTALWMWFFPVGITLMWRRSCTWPKAVKAGLTCVMMALVIAVIALPAPARTSGGIELVGGHPEVEVYGPELPKNIVSGYTNDTTQSIIVPVEENNIHYVYAADGAECYHEYECKFAYASSQRLTVYEAYYLGFKPCGRCNPPVYTGP